MFTEGLSVGVFDQNGQLMQTDSSSEGVLSSFDIIVQISGNNKAVASNGIYNFTNLQFIAQPNYNTSFIFSSSALDTQRINMVSNGSALTCKLDVLSYSRFITSSEIQTLHHRRSYPKQLMHQLSTWPVLIQLKRNRMPFVL